MYLIFEHKLTAAEGGEGEDQEDETEKKEEEEPKIPDNFYYEYENFASRPIITAESGLPEDLLTLQYPLLLYCRHPLRLVLSITQRLSIRLTPNF